jgi:hypothetical protein
VSKDGAYRVIQMGLAAAVSFDSKSTTLALDERLVDIVSRIPRRIAGVVHDVPHVWRSHDHHYTRFERADSLESGVPGQRTDAGRSEPRRSPADYVPA